VVIRLNDLEVALLRSWREDTSSDHQNWKADNPAYGQCAVTACVVQDYIGGIIVWSEVSVQNPNWSTSLGVSHYFNRLDSSLESCLAIEVDFTSRQFPKGTYILKGIDKSGTFKSTRDYVLSFEKTLLRYNLLKERVEGELR
jgi:hypothetical protein